jgi:putative FmdB family regulatory protein
MAIYEYYCPTCRGRFEQRRPMIEASTTTTCARGHRAERAISAFAVSRAGAAVALEPESRPGGGGCCGRGGCACSN